MFDVMRETRSQMECIIDEYGAFSGLVRLGDLLEEIVGEISNETEKVEPVYPITWNATYWETHGLAPPKDLERETSVQVDEPTGVSTISGLIMSKLSRMPFKEDTVIVKGIRFKVLAMKDRHAEIVRIDARTKNEDLLDGGSDVELPEPEQKSAPELERDRAPLKGD